MITMGGSQFDCLDKLHQRYLFKDGMMLVATNQQSSAIMVSLLNGCSCIFSNKIVREDNIQKWTKVQTTFSFHCIC